MGKPSESSLRAENVRLRSESEELRLRLEEAEQALEAIRTGQVESLVVEGPDGPRIFSLEGATQSYRFLVEAMNEGAATLREDGTILYCNGRFAALLELPLQRVMGSAFREHVPERCRGTLNELLERGRESSAREELPLRDSEGREIPAYLSVSSTSDGGARVLCLVATDLREQKRSEAIAAAEQAARESEARLQMAAEELRAADRRKDEFLGMLSHELRNPLAPIRNSIYILKRADPNGPQAERAKLVIERQVEHITKLVDDLLDVTRIARGKIELQRSRVDLSLLVRRAAEDHSALMTERGIEFSSEPCRGPVWTDGDPTRLTQVVGNLLQNAAKFTQRGGRVTLALEVAPGVAEIQVRDTGVGMEAEILMHVFEAFVQADRSLARTEGGLGLGLALVKGITEMHGGSVRAASAGPGQGSEFVVRLPLLKCTAADAVAIAHPHPNTTGFRVLVVDDNADGAESLAQVVELLGHTADVAYDGPSAIVMARANPPHVVLCDIGLPGMSGYEVAQTLRAEHDPRMQIVAVTGYAQAEDVKRAVEAGFDRHLSKPVDGAEIERLLGSYALSSPPRRSR